MKWLMFDAAVFAAGYVASVYTWPKVHEWWIGTADYALHLRDRMREVEAKIRGA